MTTTPALQSSLVTGYFDTPGLSQSGMKDLAISPLRYWYLHINPDRPEKRETAEMTFGSALHCAVLQPAEFESRYVCELVPPDDCLVTMEHLRDWLRSNGVTPKGTKKAEVIAQVQKLEPLAPIYDVLLEQHRKDNEGKLVLSTEDWQRVIGAAESLRKEPLIEDILADGVAEVPMFVVDPETGVPLKARMDWLNPRVTFDLKTFSQQRGKSIDKCVAHAVFYEGYHIQAYFYSLIRAIASGDKKPSAAQNAPECVLAFVESTEPFETRLRTIRPRVGGEVNLLWERARHETRTLIRLYAECVERFGEKAWRYAQEVTPIDDSEIPGLSY